MSETRMSPDLLLLHAVTLLPCFRNFNQKKNQNGPRGSKPSISSCPTGAKMLCISSSACSAGEWTLPCSFFTSANCRVTLVRQPNKCLFECVLCNQKVNCSIFEVGMFHDVHRFMMFHGVSILSSLACSSNFCTSSE